MADLFYIYFLFFKKLHCQTSKDVLGIDLAIQLAKRLLTDSGSVVLEVCRALWSLQAMKEQECYHRLEVIDTTLSQEHDRVESELDARLSLAGAAMAAVRQMNDHERQNFQNNAIQRRQQVQTQCAWELRKVLCWQQQILFMLEVPGFEEGPTVDDATFQYQSLICQYLHSAFFIRNKMGLDPHETMLKNQLKKLMKEQQQASNSSKGGVSPVPATLQQQNPMPPVTNYNLGTAQQMTQMQPPMQMQGTYNNYSLQQQQQSMINASSLPPQYTHPSYGQSTATTTNTTNMMMRQDLSTQDPGLLPLVSSSNHPPPPPPPPPPLGSYGGTQPNQQYPSYY